MRELRDLLDAYDRLVRSGGRGVLATVVAAQGSTYRRPGARMLLMPDGSAVGTISGGCLEREVAAKAEQVLASGGPLLLRYDATAPDEAVLGLGLGCQGVIDVLLEAVGPGPCAHLDFAAACVHGASPGVLATVYRGPREGPPAGARLMLDGAGARGELAGTPLGGLVGEQARLLLSSSAARGPWSRATLGDADVLLELFAAPLRLLIFGSGPDAWPLARAARQLGWDAVIAQPRPPLGGSPAPASGIEVVECGPRDVASKIRIGTRAAAVLMTHDYLTDLELARALSAWPLLYLGLLGPRRRGERLLADLASGGTRLSAEQLARVHAPAGLDVGAETPEEIALAVAAEILAALAGRSGGRLRERSGPIHG